MQMGHRQPGCVALAILVFLFSVVSLSTSVVTLAAAAATPDKAASSVHRPDELGQHTNEQIHKGNPHNVLPERTSPDSLVHALDLENFFGLPAGDEESYFYQAPKLRLGFFSMKTVASGYRDLAKKRPEIAEVLPKFSQLHSNLVCRDDDAQSSNSWLWWLLGNLVKELPPCHSVASARKGYELSDFASILDSEASSAKRKKIKDEGTGGAPRNDSTVHGKENEPHPSNHPSVVVCEYDPNLGMPSGMRRGLHTQHVAKLKNLRSIATVLHRADSSEFEDLYDAMTKHATINAGGDSTRRVHVRSDDATAAADPYRKELNSDQLDELDMKNWVCAAVYGSFATRNKEVEPRHIAGNFDIRCGYESVEDPSFDTVNTAPGAAARQDFLDRMGDHFFNSDSTWIPSEFPLPKNLERSWELEMMLEDGEHNLMDRAGRRGVLHRLPSNWFDVQGRSRRGGASEKDISSSSSSSVDYVRRVCRLTYNLVSNPQFKDLMTSAEDGDGVHNGRMHLAFTLQTWLLFALPLSAVMLFVCKRYLNARKGGRGGGARRHHHMRR